MTNDLISREALLAELAEEIEWERAQMAPITAISAFKIAIRRVKKAPAVDAEPMRHGFWKNRGNHLECNLCGHKYTRYDCEGNVVGYYLCPNCGTKMHTEARDE